MNKKYAFAAMATIAIGVAVGAAQFITAKPAAAQSPTAQCVAYDSAAKPLFQIGAGRTVLFVPQGDALMRDRGGPQTSYEPSVRDRVASVRLLPRCRAVLYGQFGANWGHRVVTATGPTGVPANHIGGVKCECS